MGESKAWKYVSSLILLRYLCVLFTPILKVKPIFVQMFRCAVAFRKSWVCKCSIRFELIKFKLLCETLKNEKFSLDIQTKCSNITNKILNVAIDAEQTFKCKWPKLVKLVKVSLAKYVAIFCQDCSYNIRFIFTNTKAHIFRTSNNQNIPNTPLRCLNFNFSIKGLSNFNCLQEVYEKYW